MPEEKKWVLHCTKEEYDLIVNCRAARLDLAKMICHDVGEALTKKYGNFLGTKGKALDRSAEYYSLIRETALACLEAHDTHKENK